MIATGDHSERIKIIRAEMACACTRRGAVISDSRRVGLFSAAVALASSLPLYAPSAATGTRAFRIRGRNAPPQRRHDEGRQPLR